MLEAAFVKSENAIRPTLPKKIDELTTLVEIHHTGSKIQYEIVIDLSKAASRATSSFMPQMRALMLSQICNSDAVKVLGIGASYEYSFRDEKSNNIGSVIIQNSDCKA